MSGCCSTTNHERAVSPATPTPIRSAEGKTLVIIGGGSAAFAAALKAAELDARDTRGLIKLIRDRQTDRLVGARILAPEGAELLMEIALAIKFGISARDLTACFHPYLTLSEGVKLAALAFTKDVNKLSCCAG